MIEHDWLAGYRNLQVIGKVLQNLSRRLSRPTPLAQSLPQLQIHYPRLREDCRQFIHAARRHLGNPPPTGEKISGL
jgi:acyl carrier protein phosphodiesterase